LPKEIEAACSLDVVAFEGGSVKVTLALRESSDQLSLLEDTGEQALEALILDLSAISATAEPLPANFELGVVEPLLDLSGLLERRIDRIELLPDDMGRPRAPVAVIDRHVRARLRAFIERPIPSEASVVGLLLEIDFKDGTAEVHEASGSVVRLSFDREQDERLRLAAKSRVRAFGTAQRDAGGRILSLRLVSLEILEEDLVLQDSTRLPGERRLTEWKSSEDPFASTQPLSDASVLIGGLPDDRTAEEILADLRASRRTRPEDH